MMKIPRNKLGTVMPMLQGDIRLGRQGCGTEEGACRGKEALRHGSEICLGAVRQGCR